MNTRTAPPGRILDARLVAALAVLLAAGGYVRYAKAHGKLQILKLPAPLRAELTGLSRGALEPYDVREHMKMDEEGELELGTRTYVHWILERPGVGPSDWRRNVSLMITYYTGNPDQVPHVPDECYTQGGGFTKDADEVLDFQLSSPPRPLPVRRLTFLPPMPDGPTASVYYTFICNGDFYSNRDAVRRRMANFREKYLYYCKVELAFHRPAGDDRHDEMDELVEGVLDRLIAALVKDHLPDMAALERTSAGGATN